MFYLTLSLKKRNLTNKTKLIITGLATATLIIIFHHLNTSRTYLPGATSSLSTLHTVVLQCSGHSVWEARASHFTGAYTEAHGWCPAWAQDSAVLEPGLNPCGFSGVPVPVTLSAGHLGCSQNFPSLCFICVFQRIAVTETWGEGE